MDFLRISKIFADDYYAVPDYQRDYEWTNVQNATLIDDVLQIAKDVNATNHFFGAIVTIPYEDGTGTSKSIQFVNYCIDSNKVKHVVDGQQRLTSFSILLKALQDCIASDETISDSFKENIAKRQISNILLGNDYYGEYAAPRLILNGNTGNCYNELLKVSTASCNRAKRGAKRLLAAYKLYMQELQSGFLQFKEEGICTNSQDYYQKVLTTITSKINFVEIECDASSDAFQVFDSLNGKGLDLTAADRIKNIFMSWSQGQGVQKWDVLVSEIGEDYLANFFVTLFFYHEKKRIAKNKLPEEFKAQYKDSAAANFDFFYNDLKRSGELFGKLRKAKTESEGLNAIIKDFESLNIDQVYVLLFAAAKHYGETIINTSEYKLFAENLQKLIVRMQVCEKSANKLDSLFSRCVTAMKDKAAPISLIITMISDEINTSVSDEVFKSAFSHFCIKDNKVAEFYLRHIEDYLRKKAGDRNPTPRGLTVEHIIPQIYDLNVWYGNTPIPAEIADDFRASVVENIGNKALLYGDDNTSAGNGDYNSKLEVYRNGKRGQDNGTPISTFKLIKNLIDENPQTFYHTNVGIRATKMAEWAVEIWKADDVLR